MKSEFPAAMIHFRVALILNQLGVMPLQIQGPAS